VEWVPLPTHSDTDKASSYEGVVAPELAQRAPEEPQAGHNAMIVPHQPHQGFIYYFKYLKYHPHKPSDHLTLRWSQKTNFPVLYCL